MNRKFKKLLYLTAEKGRQLFLGKKLHPGDLARGCSDLKMTWLLCCAGATTGDCTVLSVYSGLLWMWGVFMDMGMGSVWGLRSIPVGLWGLCGGFLSRCEIEWKCFKHGLNTCITFAVLDFSHTVHFLIYFNGSYRKRQRFLVLWVCRFCEDSGRFSCGYGMGMGIEISSLIVNPHGSTSFTKPKLV